jgi:hypothetical protein
MKRQVSGLFTAVLLGCFVVSQPAEAQERKNGGTVCLMSSVGQEFELKKVGIMVFGNEHKTIPIADWKIDEQVYLKVKSLLGENYAIKRMEISAEALREAFDETLGIFRDLPVHRRKILGDQLDSANCGYLLTITPGSSQFNSTNQFVRGLGVVDGQGLVGTYRHVYALTQLQVFEARTMQRLDQARGGSDEPLLFATIKGPHKEIDGNVEEIPAETFAADPETRKMVLAFLDRSLELSLPGLFKLGTLEAKAKTASREKTRPVSSPLEGWPRN